MGRSTADIDPANDVFYRETLKALGGELARWGSNLMEQGRAIGKLTNVTTELCGVNKGLTDAVRDLVGELRAMRGGDRKRQQTTPPVVAIPRTQTGG